MCRLPVIDVGVSPEMKALWMLHHGRGKFVCMVAYFWIKREPEVIRRSERQMRDATTDMCAQNSTYLISRIPSSMLPLSIWGGSSTTIASSLSLVFAPKSMKCRSRMTASGETTFGIALRRRSSFRWGWCNNPNTPRGLLPTDPSVNAT
jgi:hypothetical protein